MISFKKFVNFFKGRKKPEEQPLASKDYKMPKRVQKTTFPERKPAEAPTYSFKKETPSKPQTIYAIIHPDKKPRHFLHRNPEFHNKKGFPGFTGEPNTEGWTTSKEWADRFIDHNTANLVAKRKLGHDKFKIEKL
jgi:hypothetical protein